MVHSHGLVISHEEACVTKPIAQCYTEKFKATDARHRLKRHYNACANRKKQCRPNETKPYSYATHPRKRKNNPRNGHTPSRIESTHARLTRTRMRPHAPSHQAGDHPVPAHTQRHNPSKMWTQRQSGLPPRAVSSQGQRHRCCVVTTVSRCRTLTLL